ncbi:MAG TPA: helix-turn-helix domain-containing protein [Candidatus Limnocylindria bacterium]|nr:helix-turn-helix domain-containing protein [Candidatus Limnocylindria bacterium]
MHELQGHVAELHRLTRTDPDPRVRHRADALLVVAHGSRVDAAAHAIGCCPKRLRVWRQRFLAEGRAGLADRPRSGRPTRLDTAATAVLEQALTTSPLAHGYPVTTWTVADLTDLLAQRGWTVSRATVSRALQRLGYRYRRPRHDLTHRQDTAAVASAQHVLRELQKRGRLPGLDFGLSMWMNATCIPTPTWQRSGSGEASR